MVVKRCGFAALLAVSALCDVLTKADVKVGLPGTKEGLSKDPRWSLGEAN